MPRYRIHRIKEAPGESFRWAPHTGGLAVVRPKDYDFGEEMEAPTPYAVWKILAAGDQPLHPGDLLEILNPDGAPGEMQIAKYIGFEPARWYVPDPKPDSASLDASTAAASGERGHSL